MNKVKRQNIERKYALTICLEFFQREIWHGAPTERLEKSYSQLRDLCWQALGSDQSLADADEIKKAYAALRGEEIISG